MGHFEYVRKNQRQVGLLVGRNVCRATVASWHAELSYSCPKLKRGSGEAIFGSRGEGQDPTGLPMLLRCLLVARRYFSLLVG